MWLGPGRPALISLRLAHVSQNWPYHDSAGADRGRCWRNRSINTRRWAHIGGRLYNACDNSSVGLDLDIGAGNRGGRVDGRSVSTPGVRSWCKRCCPGSNNSDCAVELDCDGWEFIGAWRWAGCHVWCWDRCNWGSGCIDGACGWLGSGCSCVSMGLSSCIAFQRFKHVTSSKTCATYLQHTQSPSQQFRSIRNQSRMGWQPAWQFPWVGSSCCGLLHGVDGCLRQQSPRWSPPSGR